MIVSAGQFADPTSVLLAKGDDIHDDTASQATYIQAINAIAANIKQQI